MNAETLMTILRMTKKQYEIRMESAHLAGEHSAAATYGQIIAAAQNLIVQLKQECQTPSTH